MIREMIQKDCSRVLEIYGLGIETGSATFEIKVPSWANWDANHLNHSRLVYIDHQERILGWVALSAVSKRAVYNGVAEVSVYIDTNERGKGIGSELMRALIASSEKNGIWTLSSIVFSGNKATLQLHKKFGFRIVGTRKRIAQLNDQWKDTTLMERRSEVVGT